MKNKINDEMIDFIQKSPSMFHAVDTISSYMQEQGYHRLWESESWSIEKGGKYFVTRNDSSIIAFNVGKEDYHYQITASHSDSPTFKIKDKADTLKADYVTLNVESYGSMIHSTWLDRPLSVAGRVMVREDSSLFSHLIYIDKDILMIPNAPIHLNKSLNDGYKYNLQKEMCPIFSCGKLGSEDFDKMIADKLGVKTHQIVAKDLFLVNRQRPTIWGEKEEFISSPKLDDLQCAFSALMAFLKVENPPSISVYACFDNEEVGSNTMQGAMSTFLKDVLKRINMSLGKSDEDYYTAISKSFMVSCDNAHALHPNYDELYDKGNFALLNGGVVIKESANQKYTTSSFSRGVFASICEKAKVPTQSFANRSDIIGGSTLGNLSNIQVSINCVDIGIPQLAMHSSYETCGVDDTAYTIYALKEYYSTNIIIEDSNTVRLIK